MFKDKTISLGTWARILEDFRKESIDADVRMYRDHLKSKFTNIEFEELRKVCQLIFNERNKIAHTEVLNIKQVMTIRKKLVPQLNLVIEILYN